MELTDRIRKQMSNYLFDAGKNVKEMYHEMDNKNISYATLRLFYNGSTSGNGHTINKIDKHLKEKGYANYEL